MRSSAQVRVKVNYILTHVKGKAVSAKNWFSAFQHADPPFPIRFNTTLADILPVEDAVSGNLASMAKHFEV